MDKITKLIKKLTGKEREQLAKALSSIISGKGAALDIKKLKGVDSIYRVRTGNLRIIFKKEGGDIRILDVARKNEDTYRDV